MWIYLRPHKHKYKQFCHLGVISKNLRESCGILIDRVDVVWLSQGRSIGRMVVSAVSYGICIVSHERRAILQY